MTFIHTYIHTYANTSFTFISCVSTHLPTHTSLLNTELNKEIYVTTITYANLTASDRNVVCRNRTGTTQGRRWWEEPEEGLTDVDERAW